MNVIFELSENVIKVFLKNIFLFMSSINGPDSPNFISIPDAGKDDNLVSIVDGRSFRVLDLNNPVVEAHVDSSEKRAAIVDTVAKNAMLSPKSIKVPGHAVESTVLAEQVTAEEVLNKTLKEELDAVDEQTREVEEACAEGETALEALKAALKLLYRGKAKTRFSFIQIREKRSHLQKMHNEVKNKSTSIKDFPPLLRSGLTALRQSLLGHTPDSLRELLGEEAYNLETLLDQLGIEYFEDAWLVNQERGVGALATHIEKFSSGIDQLVLPEEHELEPEEKHWEACSSCFDVLSQVCTGILGILARILQCLNRIKLFLSRTFRIKNTGTLALPDVTIVNPFASYLGRDSEKREGSVREEINGRKDLSEDDLIRRADPTTFHPKRLDKDSRFM